MGSLDEQWRPIRGYEGLYEVSTHGHVRSLDRMVKHPQSGRVLRRGVLLVASPSAGRGEDHGYPTVQLSRDGKRSMVYVHRLVASTFLPNLAHKPEVNHKDGTKTNNCVENLEWCTAEENMQHAYALGLLPQGEASGTAVLTNEQVLAIWARLRAGERVKKIAHSFHVSHKTIRDIRDGQTWRPMAPRDAVSIRDGLTAKPPNRGEEIGNAKLTSVQVAYIKEQVDHGVPGAAIARAFGISESTVSRIKHGILWQHIRTPYQREEILCENMKKNASLPLPIDREAATTGSGRNGHAVGFHLPSA